MWMTVLLSVTMCITFTFTLGACLCCRRKVHKNDLLGLEGRMVKMSPDDVPGKLNGGASGSEANSNSDQVDHHHHTEHEKRASSATHRSLPDIPTVDEVEVVGGGSTPRGGITSDGDGGKPGDTNSDLYATVGDKVVQQRAMPGHVLGKQASISQHSSLSQADDISSPYASVRSPPHAYDKIRKAEHPYAQLQPTASNAIAETSSNGSRRASSESLLGSDADEPTGRQVEIPAASAIAGRVSASQELPYMTPPIVQPQSSNLGSQAPQLHFSGDSQDSSKGYTSISVREPLANILAQTKSARQHLQHRKLAREFQDSHYATVSDDSDEMYAAIEDPNQVGELYTSGSETYAQIQPQMVVNAEVNAAPPGQILLARPASTEPAPVASTTPSTITTMEPPLTQTLNSAPSLPPPPAQHSRQASSSSSIGGILGSPKPEKRQANSPLPPTPKGSGAGKAASGGHYLSNTTLNSGRNSVASTHGGLDFSPGRGKDADSISKDGEGSAAGKKKSPSKDLEGMYAKVMKKNKLSNVPSENSSPLFGRRSTAAGDIEMGESSTGSREGSGEKQVNMDQNNYETIERLTVTKRGKAGNNNNRDPGYETIPGDKCRRDLMDSLNAAHEGSARSRNSAPAGILAEGIHKVSQNSLNILKGGMEGILTVGTQEEPLSLISNDDPGYETVRQVGGIAASAIKGDLSPRTNSMNESSSEHDPNYETLLPNPSNTGRHKPQPQSSRFGDEEEDDGYSMIRPAGTGAVGQAQPVVAIASDNDGYSSIKDIPNDAEDEEDEPGYSQIGKNAKDVHGYASIDETRKNRLDASGGMTSSVSGTTTNSSMSPVSPISYFPAPSAEISTGLSASTTHSSEFSSTEVSLNRNSLMLTSSEGNDYESLETVRHAENPYEVLQNELGTPAADTVFVVGELIRASAVVEESGVENGRDRVKISPSDSPEVGDYFQV